ncbi:MAG: TetR/AcrR family transcriptional regulator [Candidatus Limnocylindrales bacterium]
MARTVNPVTYAARRDAYVDAALRLIQAKGYDNLSVADVIQQVGASKGAFFHYFGSKAELLAAVIDRMVEVGISRVEPVAADPDLGALTKLERVFSGIAQWKREQPELQPAAVAELMRIWYSDENATVVARLRAATRTRLTPLLAGILRQGAAEGAFSVASPEGTASVITSVMLGLQDEIIPLFLGRLDGTVSFETVQATIGTYIEAFERILGTSRLAWPIADEATLRYWFGPAFPAKGQAA